MIEPKAEVWESNKADGTVSIMLEADIDSIRAMLDGEDTQKTAKVKRALRRAIAKV